MRSQPATATGIFWSRSMCNAASAIHDLLFVYDHDCTIVTNNYLVSRVIGAVKDVRPREATVKKYYSRGAGLEAQS